MASSPDQVLINLQSGVTSGAYVPSPTSLPDIAGNAFFAWASTRDAEADLNINVNDPNVQAQINTATLYLKGTMDFVLSHSPALGGNVVAATAGLFTDLNSRGGTVSGDLLSIQQNAQSAFGSSAPVLGAVFGAIGFALAGAPGQQPYQQFGQSIGNALDGAGLAGITLAQNLSDQTLVPFLHT